MRNAAASAGGEPQVGGAQFGQLAPGAQPGQRQRRILTGGDHQVHRWRQVREQEGEGVVDRFGIDHMVVVEDKDEIVRQGGDLVEQGGQDRCGRQRRRGVEHSHHPRPDLRRDRLQGSDEVGEEARRVVIPVVQREPGGRAVAPGDPCADEGGLAEAGGGGDEGQGAVQPLVEPREQAGAADKVRPGRGEIEFGGEQWRRHRPTSASSGTRSFITQAHASYPDCSSPFIGIIPDNGNAEPIH